MIARLALSPITPIMIGLLLAWFDLVSCEPFDRLTYAWSYASGHVEQNLWTYAHASEFVQRAWLSNLPELLWRVMGYAILTAALLGVQYHWRAWRSTRSAP